MVPPLMRGIFCWCDGGSGCADRHQHAISVKLYRHPCSPSHAHSPFTVTLCGLEMPADPGSICRLVKLTSAQMSPGALATFAPENGRCFRSFNSVDPVACQNRNRNPQRAASRKDKAVAGRSDADRARLRRNLPRIWRRRSNPLHGQRNDRQSLTMQKRHRNRADKPVGKTRRCGFQKMPCGVIIHDPVPLLCCRGG
jgi:hypothetical protein